MCPKIVDKEARRKEILLAAMRVVAHKGMKNVKIDEIAEKAGIGKGTIYEYFTSKEELFGAAIIEFIQRIEDYQAKRMFRATTPQEKLKTLIDSWVEVTLSENEEFIIMMTDIWVEGIRRDNETLLKVFDLREIYARYRKIIASIISEGVAAGIFRKVDAETVAGIFLSSVDGLMIPWLLDRENIDFKKTADTLYETFMNGISAT